jgi:FkbM family methyltransferase
MFEKLKLLKQLGYHPKHILDIGAYHGNWTLEMLKIYPSAKYYLFEAIDYQELSIFEFSQQCKKFNVILNDTAKDVDWYEMRNTGDSIFREKTRIFDNCSIIRRPSIDLNTFVHSNDIFGIKSGSQDILDGIFIKIDCQGAEIPILKGATDIIPYTDFILLEIPLFGQYNTGVGTFLDHIKYMDSIGFIPYDILESHYIGGFNRQVDILFINRGHPLNIVVENQLK